MLGPKGRSEGSERGPVPAPKRSQRLLASWVAEADVGKVEEPVYPPTETRTLLPDDWQVAIAGAREVQSRRPGAVVCCWVVLPVQPGPKSTDGTPVGEKKEATKARMTMLTLGFSQRLWRSEARVDGLCP